jgi:hypothetical protein
MIETDFPLRTIESLRASKIETFWYICSPYAKYRHGKEAAFEDACMWAAKLIKAGVPAFSPIAHSHSIASIAVMDKDSHDLWMPQDLSILRGAQGVLIAPMEGWLESKGVAMEVADAWRQDKPVFLIDGTL